MYCCKSLSIDKLSKVCHMTVSCHFGINMSFSTDMSESLLCHNTETLKRISWYNGIGRTCNILTMTGWQNGLYKSIDMDDNRG